eukprot:9370901-Pyramimonas_sp.AAC.1
MAEGEGQVAVKQSEQMPHRLEPPAWGRSAVGPVRFDGDCRPSSEVKDCNAISARFRLRLGNEVGAQCSRLSEDPRLVK